LQLPSSYLAAGLEAAASSHMIDSLDVTENVVIVVIIVTRISVSSALLFIGGRALPVGHLALLATLTTVPANAQLPGDPCQIEPLCNNSATS
jgi:hypothetical protein